MANYQDSINMLKELKLNGMAASINDDKLSLKPYSYFLPVNIH